jgi:RNA polymerase sigma factor (sigma-70 family)
MTGAVTPGAAATVTPIDVGRSARNAAEPRRSRRAGRSGREHVAITATAEPAAEDLYRELAPAVLGYLRAAGAPEPEDVLGEVFLQVARDLPGFRGESDGLRRWVFSIAHNRLIDAARYRRRRPVQPVAVVPEITAPEPAEPFDPALVDALAVLTRDQRNVVMLRFVADLSIMDTARILHRPPGVVKSLQHRGLRRLEVELAGGSEI